MIATVLRFPIFNYRIRNVDIDINSVQITSKYLKDSNFPAPIFKNSVWIINNGNTLVSRNYNLYNICAHCQLRGKSIPQ